MFSPLDKRRKGSITVHPALRRAASLARAFILLEDPELSSPHVPAGVTAHPHRVPLRSDLGARRPGAGVPRIQPCTSPLPPRGSVRRAQRTWKRAADPVRVGGCASSR